MNESAPPPSTARTEYLERLTALLPTREVRRVRREVEAMILDRAEALQEREPDLTWDDAEARAIKALGPADSLAEELQSSPLHIDLSTRRSFVRTLWIVFGGHLVLSIVLTAAGAEGAAIPGLLAPLPSNPLASTLLSVLAIFLIDLGAVFLLFMVLYQRRGSRSFRQVDVLPRWTRRDAIEGLVMIALLAVIVNVFATKIFAVKESGVLRTFLSQDVIDWIPYLNVALVLFALRMLFTLIDKMWLAMLFDILGCAAAATWMVVAATRAELVQLPEGKLGQNAAVVLDGLFTRVFLLLLIVGALGLTARAIRMLLRLPKAKAVDA